MSAESVDRVGFVESLRRLGDELVTTDPGDLEELGRDWTRVYAPKPLCVVRPRTTAEVSAVVRACHEAGVGVVPSRAAARGSPAAPWRRTARS